MQKDRVITIYADTWDELTLKMIGYYHDHCHHYYAGLSEDIPERLQEFLAEDKKYVFLCEEDEPYIPEDNG